MSISAGILLGVIALPFIMAALLWPFVWWSDAKSRNDDDELTGWSFSVADLPRPRSTAEFVDAIENLATQTRDVTDVDSEAAHNNFTATMRREDPIDITLSVRPSFNPDGNSVCWANGCEDPARYVVSGDVGLCPHHAAIRLTEEIRRAIKEETHDTT